MYLIIKFLFVSMFVFSYFGCGWEPYSSNLESYIELDKKKNYKDILLNDGVLYILSSDGIDYANSKTKKVVGKVNFGYDGRLDLISMKKYLNRLLVLDDKKTIHIFDSSIPDSLVYLNSLSISDNINGFDILVEAKMILVYLDTKSVLYDLAITNSSSESENKSFSFSEIEQISKISFVNKDRTKLYLVNKLNTLISYNISDLKNIRELETKDLNESIKVMNSNGDNLFIATGNKLYKYSQSSLNSISSISIAGINDIIYYDDYIFASKGIDGISKIDIKNMKEISSHKPKVMAIRNIASANDGNILSLENSKIGYINISKNFIDLPGT